MEQLHSQYNLSLVKANGKSGRDMVYWSILHVATFQIKPQGRTQRQIVTRRRHSVPDFNVLKAFLSTGYENLRLLTYLLTYLQGCNFGLKSWGTNSEGEQGGTCTPRTHRKLNLCLLTNYSTHVNHWQQSEWSRMTYIAALSLTCQVIVNVRREHVEVKRVNKWLQLVSDESQLAVYSLAHLH